MWKSFSKNKTDPAYYLKVEVFEDKKRKSRVPEDRFRYRVSVTNYVKLWSVEFDNDGIIRIMLDSNKNVELSDGQRFLKVGLNMLNNPKQVDRMEFTESNTEHLNVKLLSIGAIVIKMNFTLSICCAEQFFDTITRPLLLIINDQKKSETELRRLIEGMRGYLSKIPRDLLMRYEKQALEEYNDVKHMEDHNMMEEIFGKDPEEGIDPKHILYGRPLPALPYYMPLPIKEELDPPSTVTTDTLIPKCGIKTEPTDVTSGSNTGTSGSNNGTSASYNSTSKSDKGTSGLKNGTTGSNYNNSLTSVGTNEINNESSRQNDAVTQSLNISPVSSITKRSSSENNNSEHLNDSSTLNLTARPSQLNSTELHQPHHRTLNVTPKKRRKNLNY